MMELVESERIVNYRLAISKLLIVLVKLNGCAGLGEPEGLDEVMHYIKLAEEGTK